MDYGLWMMDYELRIKEPVTKIFIKDTYIPIPQSERLEWENMLAPEKQQRYRSLQNEEDRRRLLYADKLARTMLAQETGTMPQSIRFSYDDHGKPYLTDHPEIHFNISHSGRYVVLCIDKMPVGIDIEEKLPLKDMDIVAKTFMSAAEYEIYKGVEEEARMNHFYRNWTAKESYIKATGKGVSEDLASISIIFSEKKITLYRGKKVIDNFFPEEIKVPEGYSCVVCRMK